jgi:hypothetical protein
VTEVGEAVGDRAQSATPPQRLVVKDVGDGRSSRDQIHFAQIDEERLMAVPIGSRSATSRAVGFTDGGRLERTADDKANAKAALP